MSRGGQTVATGGRMPVRKRVGRFVTGVIGTVMLAVVGSGCRVVDPGPADVLAPGWTNPGVLRQADVAYGGDPRQRLDVYGPPSGVAPNGGVIVWFHGGGWVTGDKSSIDPYGAIVLDLARDGWTIVSADYRLGSSDLSGGGSFPVPLHDAKTVVRWVRWHAADLGIDRRMVVVAGDSAGGTLAALVGLTVGQHEPEALPWPLAGERSAVAAWLAFNPAVDLTALAADARDVGFGLSPSIAATAFLGCGRLGPTSCASNRITSASPLAHVDAFDRPGYIVVGARDTVVPPAAHGMRLYAALLQLLGEWRVALDVVDTGPAEVQQHGGFSFGANRTALGMWLEDQVLSRVG